MDCRKRSHFRRCIFGWSMTVSQEAGNALLAVVLVQVLHVELQGAGISVQAVVQVRHGGLPVEGTAGSKDVTHQRVRWQ